MSFDWTWPERKILSDNATLHDTEIAGKLAEQGYFRSLGSIAKRRHKMGLQHARGAPPGHTRGCSGEKGAAYAAGWPNLDLIGDYWERDALFVRRVLRSAMAEGILPARGSAAA